MSDTMPERDEDLTDRDVTIEELAAWGRRMTDSETLDGLRLRAEAAEQKLLDAEESLEAHKEALESHYADLVRLRAERDALQSDLKALLPLARAGLNAYDYALAKEQYGSAIVPVLDRVSIDESLAAVRAILDREGV